MKQISVIIPFYNVEKYANRVLESLKSQTIGFENLEVICIDDFSSDNTLQILRAWKKLYSETITLLCCSSNSRQGFARNLGLKYANCEFIAFVDSDDWIEPNYFEKLYNIARKGYDVVQCDYIRDSSNNLSYKKAADSIEKNDEIIELNSVRQRKVYLPRKSINNLPHCKIIRKQLLTENNIVFTEGLAYEDSFWGMLLNMYFKKAYITHEQLYHYFINSSSTSLSTNEFYHIDLLTNQILLWNELEARGLMDEYREEIEIEHVYSCALIFWKMIVLRYDVPQYSLYRLLCSIINEHIPNIMNNSYISNNQLSEKHMLLLKSCFTVMNKSDFLSFADSVKKIGL